MISSMIWNIIPFIFIQYYVFYRYGIYCVGFYVQEASQYFPLLHYLCTSQYHPLPNGDEFSNM